MNAIRKLRFHLSRTSSLTVACAVAMVPGVAAAQSTPADEQSSATSAPTTAPAPATAAAPVRAAASAPTPGEQQEIVITGRPAGSGINKLEAGYSITTLSANDIKLQAPKSSGDLLKSIPGVWIESSGGVGDTNVFVRGIPTRATHRS